MKFVHTVEICLKNATTGESFVEYSQGVVQKWRFSEANISKKKADFDPRPPPMENMDLLLAEYT
jgi:hypothetical protein